MSDMGWGGWYDAKLLRSHSTQKKTWQEQFRDIKICRPQLHHHWLDAGDLEVCFSNSSSLFCVLISLFSASASSSRNCSIILSFWRRRLVLVLMLLLQKGCAVGVLVWGLLRRDLRQSACVSEELSMPLWIDVITMLTRLVI
jgi:hypothetical protein